MTEGRSSSVEIVDPKDGPDVTIIPRLVCALAAAGLMALNIGQQKALIWLGVCLAGELLVFAASRPFAWKRPLSRRHHVLNGGAVLIQTSIWTAPAILFWFTQQPPLQLVAMGLLALMLFFACTFAYRDPISILLCGAPPMLAFMLLPLLFSHYPPTQHLTVVLSTLILVAFAGVIARANLNMLRALVATQARLVEQSAAAQNANVAKSDFLARMSHELRTPLNGILGLANVLRATRLDEVQTLQVDTLIRSGENLRAILNDVLDLSKVESGKLELDLAAFSIADLIAQIEQTWGPICRGKGVTLRVEQAPGAPTWLVGDALRVRQIVQNLVSNAVKFTDEGEVVLSVAAAPGRDGVVLSVRDTGVGIDIEAQRKLFSPFTQAAAGIAREHGGTGLGLSICRQFCALMGGEITLESAPGEGSTFRVQLPLPSAPPVEKKVEAVTAYDLQAKRVLLVEDNAVNQFVAGSVLESAGMSVEFAADGVDALAHLKAGRYDLVLMDIHMPRMDGLEATARIRRGEAGDPDVPIIALTADAMAGERERLQALGFDGLQGKPILPVGLLNAIAEMLSSDPQRRPAGLRASA